MKLIILSFSILVVLCSGGPTPDYRAVCESIVNQVLEHADLNEAFSMSFVENVYNWSKHIGIFTVNETKVTMSGHFAVSDFHYNLNTNEGTVEMEFLVTVPPHFVTGSYWIQEDYNNVKKTPFKAEIQKGIPFDIWLTVGQGYKIRSLDNLYITFGFEQLYNVSFPKGCPLIKNQDWCSEFSQKINTRLTEFFLHKLEFAFRGIIDNMIN